MNLIVRSPRSIAASRRIFAPLEAYPRPRSADMSLFDVAQRLPWRASLRGEATLAPTSSAISAMRQPMNLTNVGELAPTGRRHGRGDRLGKSRIVGIWVAANAFATTASFAQESPQGGASGPIVPDSQFEEAMPPLDPELDRPLEPLERVPAIEDVASGRPAVVPEPPPEDPALSEPLPPLAGFDVEPVATAVPRMPRSRRRSATA